MAKVRTFRGAVLGCRKDGRPRLAEEVRVLRPARAAVGEG
jgi:hypothetical protein